MVVAGAVAAPAIERGLVALPCPGRYVVIRARGSVADAGAADGIVLGTRTIALGTACAPGAARSIGSRRGWRLRAGLTCGPRARVFRLRARISEDCTLLRGTLGGVGSGRGRFTAIASRCGDGVIDADAPETGVVPGTDALLGPCP